MAEDPLRHIVDGTISPGRHDCIEALASSPGGGRRSTLAVTSGFDKVKFTAAMLEVRNYPLIQVPPMTRLTTKHILNPRQARLSAQVSTRTIRATRNSGPGRIRH